MKHPWGYISYLILASGIGLITTLAFFGLPGLEDRVDRLTLDILFATRVRQPRVSPSLVLLEIDDASIEKFGAWPWSRSVHGRMVNALAAVGAKCVAFDTLFIDRADEGGDAAFSAAVAGFDVALPVDAQFKEPLNPRQEEALNASLILSARASGTDLLSLPWVTPPFPELASAASGLAHVVKEDDVDGKCRRIPIVAQLPDGLIPSLPLRLAMNALDASPDDVELLPGEAILIRPSGRNNALRIPLDDAGSTIINFPDPHRHPFPSLSFAAQLEALEQHPDDLRAFYRDKVVLIGCTFTTSREFVTTPMGRRVRLLEVLASTTNMILTGAFLRPVSGAVIALLTILCPVLIAVSSLRRPLSAIALWSSFTLVFLIAAWALFNWTGATIDFFPVVFALILTGASKGAITYTREWRTRIRAQNALARFASADLFSLITDKTQVIDSSLRTRRELTVFFIDLVGFSRYCDETEPEEVMDALEAFYCIVEECVDGNGGQVSKIIGDGVLCLFVKEHLGRTKEQNAACAAADILKRLNQLNEDRRKIGLHNLETRTGVTTGHATVGVIGGRKRLDYTVIGRVVNLAARFAGLAPPNGVMTDERTASRISTTQGVLLREESIDIRGIDRPVEAFIVSFEEPQR